MRHSKWMVLGLAAWLWATGAEGFQQAGKTPFLKPSSGPAFIENRGQINGAVQFYARSGHQAVYVADGRVVFDLVRQKQNGLKGTPGTPSRERLVFSLRVVGARETARFQGLEETGTLFHFFKGSDSTKWAPHVPTFRKLVCKEIYPGTDMILSFTDQGMEYAFEVRAGADPGQIQLAYEGVDGIRLDDEGSLVVDTPLGPMKETAPVLLQEAGGERKAACGGFSVNTPGRRVMGLSCGFDLPEYDREGTLVIAPTLIYSSFLGGSKQEYGWGVAVDGSGCAHVTGYTASTDFPTENGYQPDYGGGNWDAFVTKYRPDGSTVAYSSYLGGSLNDEGHGLTVDSTGCAYVTGYTRSDNFPTTAGAYDTTHNGGPDVFVTKLSADGSTLVYSTYLGGSDETVHGDNPLAIAVDWRGNAYVTGRTFSGDFPTTRRAFQTAKSNGTATPDIFVSSFNTAGSRLLYSTYLGGSATDYGYGIAVDRWGCAYVGGWTNSTDFPITPKAFQTTIGDIIGDTTDAVVLRLIPAGRGPRDLAYATYLGGAQDDAALDLALDSAGTAYVTGYTRSSLDFPITPSAFQPAFAGGVSDVFMTGVTPDGRSLSYSTYLGGSDDAAASGAPESGFGIAIQGAYVHIVGYTNATDFPTRDAYQAENAGMIDLFLSKLSPGVGTLDHSTYIGGVNNDIGLRVAVDRAGNAFATGYVGDGFPQVNPAQAFFGGSTYDAFILKYDDDIPMWLDLTFFGASASRGRVLVRWHTAAEVDVAGFHLWRALSAAGGPIRITDAMIPARGGMTWGSSYAYQDWNVAPQPIYWYWLEAVSQQEESEFYGPVSTFHAEKSKGSRR